MDSKKISIGFILAAFAIVVPAFAWRQIAPDMPVWSIVYPLFLVLVMAWCASWFVRIADLPLRRILVGVSLLILFWLIIRYARLIDEDPFALRMLWYLYYVAFTMLPVFLLWTGMHLRGLDEKPYYPFLKWIPLTVSVVLLLLVLTNDWTQLVFQFPQGFEHSETVYTRGWPYYVIALRYLYLIGAFMFMTVIGRKPPLERGFLPLMLVLLVTMLYGVAYVLQPPLVILKDMTIVYCTLTVTFIELCLYSEIILSRKSYKTLLEYLRAEGASPSSAKEHPNEHPEKGAPIDLSALTGREEELLMLLVQGESPKKIAHSLGISRSTVNFHTKNLYRKTQVCCRHELMALLVRSNPLVQRLDRE